MGQIIEIGATILSDSQRSLELVAQNIANISTPGYKAVHKFPELLSILDENLAVDKQNFAVTVDPRSGKLVHTGNPLDLAIEGEGFFVLQTGGSSFYGRSGQFVRHDDGRIVTADGLVLQGDNGDIFVKGKMTITPQGVVLDDGAPVGRLLLVQMQDGGHLQPLGNGVFVGDGARMIESASMRVHQGAIETSNVSSADEMLAMMTAIRRAETGQRLVQVYDDLMGKAMTLQE